MITETSIRCLLSLAETLSFTKTAKQLFTTQQAVSQQISRLEEDLGTRLFYRDNRRVALTEHGKLVYRFFWETSCKFQELQEVLGGSQNGRLITLNVGYLRWLDISAPDVHTSALLQQEYENQLRLTTFRYNYKELNRRFDENALDVVITMERWLPQNTSGLVILPLYQRPIYLYVSASHPLAKPDAVFEDFLQETFYVDQFEGESLSDTVRRGKYDWEPDPARQLQVAPNRETALIEVALGNGVMMGGPLKDSNTLVCYPTHTTDSVVLFYRKDTENPLVAQFAALLQNAYQDIKQKEESQ